MAMEVDEPVRATSARKRRLTQPLDEDEDEGPDWSHYDATTASSKRSRAGAGHAVERRRALALVVHGTPADSWTFNKLLTQILPIHTIDAVQLEADESLQDFLAAYAGPSDLVTLLDAEGNCIWDSCELHERHTGGSTESRLHHIEAAIASNLRSLKTAEDMKIAMY
ncbi:hypothetical protein LTR78_002424 [Recurvomyces mirabilis]|uniref:Uncharacterized protein n=1 Tax=Recurvomyces mirabilis TaxID=574656 RepID=A0AAE0WTP5_9PEZI|nr:hypothetical protein LTR78_002424 [Recurvomyces mirabilis]KAK5157353.1 hypothetical protein LTS14_004118 [Recurvomyces mirabilis]